MYIVLTSANKIALVLPSFNEVQRRYYNTSFGFIRAEMLLKNPETGKSERVVKAFDILPPEETREVRYVLAPEPVFVKGRWETNWLAIEKTAEEIAATDTKKLEEAAAATLNTKMMARVNRWPDAFKLLDDILEATTDSALFPLRNERRKHRSDITAAKEAFGLSKETVDTGK